jgi:hypothetical protein
VILFYAWWLGIQIFERAKLFKLLVVPEQIVSVSKRRLLLWLLQLLQHLYCASRVGTSYADTPGILRHGDSVNTNLLVDNFVFGLGIQEFTNKNSILLLLSTWTSTSALKSTFPFAQTPGQPIATVFHH